MVFAKDPQWSMSWGHTQDSMCMWCCHLFMHPLCSKCIHVFFMIFHFYSFVFIFSLGKNHYQSRPLRIHHTFWRRWYIYIYIYIIYMYILIHIFLFIYIYIFMHIITCLISIVVLSMFYCLFCLCCLQRHTVRQILYANPWVNMCRCVVSTTVCVHMWIWECHVHWVK